METGIKGRRRWSFALVAILGILLGQGTFTFSYAKGTSYHWVRSPLTNVSNACQTCHNIPEEQLVARITTIQNRTATLLRTSEEALLDAMDTIVAAREAGATDDDLAEALVLHRSAQLRWDFVSSENSTGFHSPQESARVLANSIDLAHRARIAALEVLYALEGGQEAGR